MHPIALEPVGEVVITTLVDKSYDALMGDAGPAHRAPLPGSPVSGHGNSRRAAHYPGWSPSAASPRW